MRNSLYRFAVVTGIVGLAILIGVQSYWFVESYKLQDKQFDEKVNLALRAVADGIRDRNAEHEQSIDPVVRTHSNRYFVPVHGIFSYPLLDSIVKTEFQKHEIDQPFNISIYNESDSLILGSLYANGRSSETGTCVDRAQEQDPMNFALTFTNQPAYVLGSMNLWIFSAAIVALLFLVIAFLISHLARQRKLALAKNDFLSNMTHELQTPITNISMASEVLINNPALPAEKKSRYMQIIFDENQRLKRQVEQVLESSAMESGEISLTKEPVDIHQLIRAVTENFRIRIEQKFGILSTNLKASNPWVTGDALHLANIFYNLLDNAEKYSQGKPVISIYSENVGNALAVSIEDRGVGISPSDQRSIFEKFYRVSTGNIHDVKGFGLGLNYVKKIVDAHQGAITVNSHQNSGSRFTITFPEIIQRG